MKQIGIDNEEYTSVVGMMSPPDLIDKIQQRKLLRRLNTVNVFDFDYEPIDNDRLTLVTENGSHNFLYKNGKWNYEEFYGSNPVLEYILESKGYLEGPKSKLKILYKEYLKKREQDGVEVDQIDFVKCGWSNYRMSEKQLIGLLEDPIAGKQVKLPEGYEPTGEGWF